MLSESEQRRLAEIESALLADDPAFARRFTAWHSRRRTRRRVRTPLAVAGVVIGMVTGLAAGSGVGFLIGFLVVAAAAITVMHRH